MNSIFKYKEKGYSVPRIKILKLLFELLGRLWNRENFRRARIQCLAALCDFEKTENLLLDEIMNRDGIEDSLRLYMELCLKELKTVEGLKRIYELGKTTEEAFLTKRIASWLEDIDENEKSLELYLRLLEHPELTSLEELDLTETMEFFMGRKSYLIVIALGEKILEKKPDLMRIAYMRAEAHERIGDLKLAKASFSKMLERGKKKMGAEEYRVLQHLCNMHLGNIGITEAEPLTALAFFKKAEDAGIDRKEAVRGRAIACFQAGDYEGAIEAYDVLESEFDMKFVSFYGKGVAYKAMGKNKEAKSWLLQAEELEPENQSVLYNMSHLEYLDENNEIALELIDRALETDPEDPDTLYGKAMVYTAMHKYGDAIEIFNEVLKKKTESAEVYCRKADALRHMGRLDEAAYNYDVALQKNIGLTEAYYGKGMVLAAKGDLSEALQVMDDTISINQGFVDAYIGRSMIQMYFNDLEDGNYYEGEGLKN